MKRIFLSFAFVSLCFAAAAQTGAPIALRASTDYFTVREKFGTFDQLPLKNDTIKFGTNLYSNVIHIVTDLDSTELRFDPKWKPYGRTIQINIQSPTKKEIVYYEFYDLACEFTPEYMNSAQSRVQFDIPEAYELANVLCALASDKSPAKRRTYTASAYYQHMQDHFKLFGDDPLIVSLKEELSGNDAAYFNFRENSFCFSMKGNQVARNYQYNVVTGEMKNNLFEKYLRQINLFANKSKFDEFYRANKSYYDSLVTEQERQMPVRAMWTWLESHFSDQFQSYRVIFSPLIWGSHSTQQFWWITDDGKSFGETVMFVSGPTVFSLDTLSDLKKEALASGIVFTEIDHNYVNPISDRFGKEIDSAMSPIGNWLSKDGDAELYQSPMAVFNEYMTHALYLLYAHDHFPAEIFAFCKASRESLMVSRRKYFRFREFDEELLRLYLSRTKGMTMESLFLPMIEWAKQNNSKLN